MAGLPAGGGKAVLYRHRADVDRAKVFAAFGDAVDALGGKYITAEDVGTSVADMEVVARRTQFVAGLPKRQSCAGGDPSPWTALGVLVSMQAALGRPLLGARVAVQGLGSVGSRLCELLHERGARLVVADINPEREEVVRNRFGAELAPVDGIHRVHADVFSPNALGACLNSETIPELGAPVVCGGANNQLADSKHGVDLHVRGVTYAPDYVVNAGGIINVMAEHLGERGDRVEARVRAIGDRVATILSQARAEHRPPHEVADRMARERLGRSQCAT
jgi:leucine dehydrogenase